MRFVGFCQPVYPIDRAFVLVVVLHPFSLVALPTCAQSVGKRKEGVGREKSRHTFGQLESEVAIAGVEFVYLCIPQFLQAVAPREDLSAEFRLQAFSNG